VIDQNVKAGVSHRLLRPALGIVDPLNTLSAPPEVTAAAGADILTHAIESYTTRPYNARPKHHPPDRPARGHRGRRRRHPHARDRVVHDAPLQRAAQAPSAGSARLHRRQPGQRHLV
jgi:hypothetical protein